MLLHRELVACCPVPTLLESWEAMVRRLDSDILSIKRKHWPSLMALYREHLYLIEAWNTPNRSNAERATHLHVEVGWYRLEVAEGRLPPEGEAVDRVSSFLSIHYAGNINLQWVATNVGFLSLRARDV